MKREKNTSWKPMAEIVSMIEDRIVPDDLPNMPRNMIKDIVSRVSEKPGKAAVYAGPKNTRIEYHESVVQDAVDYIKKTGAVRYSAPVEDDEDVDPSSFAHVTET